MWHLQMCLQKLQKKRYIVQLYAIIQYRKKTYHRTIGGGLFFFGGSFLKHLKTWSIRISWSSRTSRRKRSWNRAGRPGAGTSQGLRSARHAHALLDCPRVPRMMFGWREWRRKWERGARWGGVSWFLLCLFEAVCMDLLLWCFPRVWLTASADSLVLVR